MSMSNRVCQKCGNSLASGEVFCSNCGTRYFEPGAVEPTQRASSPYPGVSSPAQPAIEPTQYAGPAFAPSSPYAGSSYDNSPYGLPSTSYGSPGSNYTPPPPPAYIPSPPSNVPYGYGQQQPGQYGGVQGVYGQQGQYGAGYPQPPQPKKGPNIGLILGVVVLLVLLIGGGLFFLTRPKVGTTNANNPTPGVTQNAVPTPQPLFSDNFADNSKGWATGNDNGFSRNITNNALVLVENNQNYTLTESLPTNSTFSDFTVTATFTFDHGDQNDSVGIYMRGDSNLNHDYRVDINGGNTFDIAREYIDTNNKPQQQFIIDATSSSAIKPIGQQNTVTAIMKGSQLVLLINGTKVDSISDTNYTSGQIALFVAHGNTSKGAQASFTSVTVYPAPAQLP
jgi:Domain of Unknown Function (DUF1080)